MDTLRALGQKEGIRIRESEYLLFGGFRDAERCIACFLPSYMTKDSFLLKQDAVDNGLLSCLAVRPVNARFSDELTHRDYLGAIMNLGMERDVIGDIICSSEYAAVAVLTSALPVIEKDLVRVRHTTVICERIPFRCCDIEPEFEEVHINIASERADLILGAVFHLSRSASQELIRTGLMSVNGREITDPGKVLKDKDRVSVRSKGKFVYAGQEGTTRKGRISALVSVYR
ncbi:MAG: RNA-binding protein [Lachnospiraceae bacterium]|nr:RNA-binding protein [Lachnospiraceae bacterium]